ncbi:MAG: DUF6527 family protein [candidate division WOR-3 bacterium]|nr:DUF6527 family protein [candidate division WOR-3 bacterium]
MKLMSITPVSVDSVPEQLEPGILYISEENDVVMHLCCCGCGLEVVTPLSPAEWSIRRSGNTVSLRPSIGNWDYPCRSHYWITNNRVEWAGPMSKKRIAIVKERDRVDKRRYIDHVNAEKLKNVDSDLWSVIRNLFNKLKSWF